MFSSYSASNFLFRIQYAVVTFLTRATANSISAVVIWIAGSLATRTFLLELGIISPEWSWLVGLVLAVVVQSILTTLEGPVWHPHLRTKKMRLILGVAALTIDTALNTGGCWYFLQNLGNTTTWIAISSASTVQSAPAALTVLILAFGLGLIISAAPEALWDL